MRSVFYIGLAFFVLSCSGGAYEEKAIEICNCYDNIHNVSTMAENSQEVETAIEKCNLLYENALNELKDSPKEKKEFITAYRKCQEQ